MIEAPDTTVLNDNFVVNDFINKIYENSPNNYYVNIVKIVWKL